MSKQITLSAAVIDALRNADVDGAQLQLTAQLDRKLYLEVAKAIEALGGKWNRKAKAHVFAYDAGNMIEDAIATGAVTNLRDLYQFFPTPAPVAKQLVELADVRRGQRVLEPSAGTGAIVEHILAQGVSPDCCELWDRNRETLLERFEIECVSGDFLAHKGEYDRIVANPPFSQLQDVVHVEHMIKLLAPGGKLASVMSPRWVFATTGKAVAFKQWLKASPHLWTWDLLPEGTFKPSGTNVRAGILRLSKVE